MFWYYIILVPYWRYHFCEHILSILIYCRHFNYNICSEGAERKNWIYTVMVYEWTKLTYRLNYWPDQQTCYSLRAVASGAVTDPKHRGDVTTTPPTRQTTLEMVLSQRNRLVESGEGRNPASRMWASPRTSGRTGSQTSTHIWAQSQNVGMLHYWGVFYAYFLQKLLETFQWKPGFVKVSAFSGMIPAAKCFSREVNQ